MIEQIKAFVKNIYPTTTEFVAYINPFFKPIKNEYEEYLRILEKVGINDGINGMVGIICGLSDSAVEKSYPMLDRIIAKVGERFKGKEAPDDPVQFFEMISDLVSYESSVEHGKEMYESIDEFTKNYDKINDKVQALSESEKATFDFFDLLIMKLWTRKLVTYQFPADTIAMNWIMKDVLIKYYKGMNNLYANETVPKVLIEYLESIDIPDESKWRALLTEAPKGEYTRQTVLPQFQHVSELLLVLLPYFSKEQHTHLTVLLNTGNPTEKLHFMGNANQLADAFKQAYDHIIKGCNKQELIDWIYANFTYKGRHSNNVTFDKKNLEQLISANHKPCKNPIIEIKREQNGGVIILPISRKGRQ